MPFSVGGSYIGDAQSDYLKGLVKDPGQANDVADDLKGGVILKFEEIPDMTGEDYPDFETMQADANAGQFIVGAYRATSGSGHVVMIVPGEAEKHPDQLRFQNRDQTDRFKLPQILECGSNQRKSSTLISTNMSENQVQDMNWYKLKIVD